MHHGEGGHKSNCHLGKRVSLLYFLAIREVEVVLVREFVINALIVQFHLARISNKTGCSFIAWINCGRICCQKMKGELV